MPPPAKKKSRPTSDPLALRAGTRLGAYTIEGLLGRGGFGFTYLARSREADGGIVKVAIKELFPDGVDRKESSEIYVMSQSRSDLEIFEDAKTRFHAEAIALKKCRHPNVVRILDYFAWNNTGYIIMAYEEGEQLGNYLKREYSRGAAPEKWILNIVTPLLDGLAHAHQQGVFHRDIKPANVFLTANNRPVLLDFGAAKQLNQQHRYNIGKNSVLFVTDGFSPFEQYTYEGRIGPWTDLYAVGALIHMMVTGRPPAKGLEREYSAKSGRDSYQRLRDRRDLPGSYSSELLAAVDWALELEVSRRPQSVDQWRSRLPGWRPPVRPPPPERTSLIRKTTMLLNLTKILTRKPRHTIPLATPAEPALSPTIFVAPPPLPPDLSDDQGKLAVKILMVVGCIIVIVSLVIFIINQS
jgi:serine/threonine protein kinase